MHFYLNALNLFYERYQNWICLYNRHVSRFCREHDYKTRQRLVLNIVFSLSRLVEICILFYFPLENISSQCVLENVRSHFQQGFSFYVRKRMTDRYASQCPIRSRYICNLN